MHTPVKIIVTDKYRQVKQRVINFQNNVHRGVLIGEQKCIKSYKLIDNLTKD